MEIKIDKDALRISINESAITTKDLNSLLQNGQLLDKRSHSNVLSLTFEKIQIIPKSKEKQLYQIFSLYRNIGFDKINIIATNAILSSQVSRIAKAAGLNHTQLLA